MFIFLSYLHLFNCKKLFALQIFVMKFLLPITLSLANFTSLPGDAIEIRVNLKLSAPYSLINSNGSITLPLDFDIF